MVPTAEARITLHMLYSAVSPIGIASARLAMLPPVELRPGLWDTPRPVRLRRRRRGTHLYTTGYSFLLNPPCDPRQGMRARSSAAEGLWAPFIYASARVVQNDLTCPRRLAVRNAASRSLQS